MQARTVLSVCASDLKLDEKNPIVLYIYFNRAEKENAKIAKASLMFEEAPLKYHTRLGSYRGQQPDAVLMYLL